jgi:hypothetical protein
MNEPRCHRHMRHGPIKECENELYRSTMLTILSEAHYGHSSGPQVSTRQLIPFLSTWGPRLLVNWYFIGFHVTYNSSAGNSDRLLGSPVDLGASL